MCVYGKITASLIACEHDTHDVARSLEKFKLSQALSIIAFTVTLAFV